MSQLSLKKQQSLTAEKRQFFSIRRLKVGTASVAIASALFFLGVGNVHAESPLVSEAQVSAQVSPTEVSQVSKAISTPTAIVGKEVSSSLAASESSSLQNSASKVDASTSVAVDNTAQNQALAVEKTPTPTPVTEIPIAKGDIRLHFQEVTDTNVKTSGLWTWGGC
ncbi:YSIRK-type signal peptide-containing protein [Streptococcus iniae]|uniref:YSIRK-type signal peptide-containing protein n=1 Tax=Streptococcus iniae TaxID=1346 RepID=UPI0032D58C51